MKPLLQCALELAEYGFYVFPLRENGKKPAIEAFPDFATRDVDQIKLWWARNSKYNVGIYTGKFNTGAEALLAVDVDNKGEKKGDEAIIGLELAGELTFPPTFEQITPTGGRHLIYRVNEAVRQGVDVLAPGLDIRSQGGYLVGAGSMIDGKAYIARPNSFTQAPEELIFRCKKPRATKIKDLPDNDPVKIDALRALRLAQRYLAEEAPLAVEGQHGDQTTFIVACKLKDFGISSESAFNLLCMPETPEVMGSGWNDKCSPPWELNQLKNKIENAYRYGHDVPGAANPEVIFKDVPVIDEKQPDKLHPILELNKEYAFVIIGGRSFVLYETTDFDGRFKLSYLTVQTFQQKLLPVTLVYNDKKHQVADLWLRSQHRRSYDGVCFMPGQKSPDNLYNLWRGFSVQPAKDGEVLNPKAQLALDLFLEHTLENICENKESLFNWLIGYFAHLIQRPFEKPIVAPVFKGSKGVGKNSFVECIGELLGSHYNLASDARYLMGNFNSHLENCLLFVLDEAFWSGDKKAEGRLKDIITGKAHNIERKGAEPYSVKNCTRVVILGNEDWLIPASHDERRFAVFNIGENRKNDGEFFGAIKEGMEAGGYRLLLKYLNDFDFKKVDIYKAPNTIGLAEQKVSSLSPFYEWWFECLRNGKIIGADFSGEWELEIDRDRFRNAYRRVVKERGLRIWGETDNAVGRLLKACLPSVKGSKKQNEGVRVNTYCLPDLDTSRKEWCTFIGHQFNWE